MYKHTWQNFIFIKLWANFYPKGLTQTTRKNILILRETETKTLKCFLWLLHIATFEVVQIFWFIWFCKFPVGMKCANYIFWTHMFFFWDFTEQRNRMNAVRFLSCKINNTNNPFLKIFINNEGSSHYCFWEFQISWWLLNRR